MSIIEKAIEKLERQAQSQAPEPAVPGNAPAAPAAASAALQVGTSVAERKPGRIGAPTGKGISGRRSRAAANGIAPRERPSSCRVARKPRTTPSRSTAETAGATSEAARRPGEGRNTTRAPAGAGGIPSVPFCATHRAFARGHVGVLPCAPRAGAAGRASNALSTSPL